METKKPNETPKKSGAVVSNVRGIKNAFLVIIACFIVALCIFLFLLGNPDNFNEAGHPINLLGTVYMGGFVVPILQCCFLTVIVLSVERWIALSSAKGKGSIPKFVANVKKALAAGNIAEAQNLCRKQQGSVGAIVYATLLKYDEMDKNTILEKEQKITMIQKELEEATALEMPSLQQNLPIVATLTTLGTLLGLLGTVLGMIRSFAALASGDGATDSQALSTGISEALVNTATGIATGALAVISYNYFSNKIDNLTYAIDEIGFCIVNAYAKTH